MSPVVLALPVGFYLVGWAVEFVRFWRAAARPPLVGGGALAVGWGAHTVVLAYRLWSEGGTLEGTVSAVAWLAMIGYFGIHHRWQNAVLGFVIPPFAVAALLSTMLLSEQLVALPGRTALDSWLWRSGLVTHILAILAGHLLLAMACVFSVMYLYQEHQIKAKVIRLLVSRLPSLKALDTLNHRAIALGFFFLSLGILLGIALSGTQERAVGTTVGWRQIVPAITWLVYASFLVQQALQGRGGRLTAIWSIAGFGVVVASLVVELYFLVQPV